MIEIWKDVLGFEGIYQISSIGRVKSVERYIKHWLGGVKIVRERILKQNTDTAGYKIVDLWRDGNRKTATIHQLVMIAFLNHSPNGYVGLIVDHINNDKLDNRIENLQLITQRKNCSKDKNEGTSVHTGVSWNKRDKKWVASIGIKSKTKYLGYFTNELDASKAYQKELNKILTNN